jgi:hypothetical protein
MGIYLGNTRNLIPHQSSGAKSITPAPTNQKDSGKNKSLLASTNKQPSGQKYVLFKLKQCSSQHEYLCGFLKF